MLNTDVGAATEVDGKRCILTRAGSMGHAVYGPYQQLDAGNYVVEFNLTAAEGQHFDGDDVCATVDVAAEFGHVILTSEDVALSRLRDGPLSIRLAFQTDVPRLFEFRVGVTGRIPLLIEDYCRVLAVNDANADCALLLEATKFPDPTVMTTPAFFLQHQAILRRLYESGAAVRIIGGDVVITIDDISFHARVADDLRFVDEIFFRNAYNFSACGECWFAAIYVNVGRGL